MTLLLRRIGFIGSGLVLMALGVVMAPSPLPIGFILFVVGIYLVARGSRWARRLFKATRRWVPAFSRGLNRVKHRLPRPMRSFIERSDPGE